jgi:predicted enzyme related to lactoylglutathione lyase
MLKSFDLAWIVVSDIKKARKFFTESLGLKEGSYSAEHGWAEMSGHDGGTRIGISEDNPMNGIKPGQNAVITITVGNIAETVALFKQNKVQLIGDIIEIPGHVKMQMFMDGDGNRFQVVQTLYQT